MSLNLQVSDTKILKYLFLQSQWFDQIDYLRKIFSFYKTIDILMFYTHEELSKYIHINPPSWVIATHINNKILILDYEVWKSRNLGYFGQIVTHELVHVILNNLNHEVPIWLNEGLAVYFAKQLNNFQPFDAKLFVANIYNANYDYKNFYCNCGFIVKKIIESNGMDVLSKISAISNFEMDQIFGIENLKILCS